MPDLAGQRRLLLIVMLLALVLFKLQVLFGIQGYGPDGSYYADVARQVRDGQGLRSWLSMYHSGFRDFPHQTTIYPIWPLILGYCSRVLPFDFVAFGFPTLFFFGALVVGARLAVTVWPRPLFPGVWDLPRADHLFVMLFGYNVLFFEFTSKPYTEGLAWLGLFALLWRVRAFFATPSALRAFELGVWAGLLILVRAQMFLVTLAGVGTLVWMVLFLRSPRWAGYAAASVAGWALALFPQMWWLSSFTDPKFDLIMRFEHYRASEVLEPVVMLEPLRTPLALLVDRLRGFEVAYRASGRYRYEANFGALHWAPAVALPWLIADIRRAARAGTGAARTWLTTPVNGLAVFYGLLALGGFFSIHSLHKSYGAEWNFATRHALTVLFLFGSALVYLGTKDGFARVLALGIVSVSVWMQGHDLSAYLASVRGETPITEYKAEVVAFVNAERARDPGLVLVADGESQRLAQVLPGVSMHWTWEGTPLSVVLLMFDELGADYLLAPVNLTEMEYGRDRVAFDAAFEPVRDNLNGYAVYRRRGGS